MFCVYCGKELARGSSSCIGCGRDLKKRLLSCSTCGFQSLEGDSFCLRCGSETVFSLLERGKTLPPVETTTTRREAAYSDEAEIERRVALALDGISAGKTREPEKRVIEMPVEPHGFIRTPKSGSDRHDDFANKAPVHETSGIPGIESPFAREVRNARMREHEPLTGKVLERPNGSSSHKKFIFLGVFVALLVISASFLIFMYREAILDIFGNGYAPEEWVVQDEEFYGEEYTPEREEVEYTPAPTPSPTPPPEQVALPELAAQRTFAVGAGHFHAIDENGGLWAWGAGGYGQLGDGASADRDSPVWIMGNAIHVVSGSYHTLVVTADGSLWGFGQNGSGQLGTGDTNNRTAPTWLMGSVVFAYVLGDTTYAITAEGSLWRWGIVGEAYVLSPTWVRDQGIFYVNESEEFDVATNVNADLRIADFVVGENHMLVLRNDGALFYGEADLSLIEAGWEQVLEITRTGIMLPWQNTINLSEGVGF